MGNRNSHYALIVSVLSESKRNLSFIHMPKRIYPGVSERVKAVTLDGITMIVLMCCTAYLFSLLDTVDDIYRISAFLFIFFLYDPLCTSFLGGTIGHMLVGIRVKKESDETKNINLFYAFFRYLAKALLGWLSLLFVSSNDKGRALHDYVGESVVVYTGPPNYTSEEISKENQQQEENQLD
jgi:uncharacterized RDD family membrane protein YckC